MTIDEGSKPEGAPERSPNAGEGAPSGVNIAIDNLRHLHLAAAGLVKKGEGLSPALSQRA
jgi:hypothetical protein